MKCGWTLKQLVLLAIIEDAGGEGYPHSMPRCPDNEHDFDREPQEVIDCPYL
jgi:hypothetical protein